MSNIDWSKAPGDCTHYLTFSGREGIGCWIKFDGDEWFAMYADGEDTEWESDVRDLDKQAGERLVKRPVEWSGTGLPPVGCKFEYMCGDGPWYEAEMRYIMQSCEPECWYVIAYCPHLGYEQGFNWKSVVQFRTIRTQEQIEAEEREKAIDEICYDICFHFGNPKGSEKYLNLATKLHDLGYRKQPKEDA